MRAVLLSIIAAGMALTGCNHDRRDEPAARQLGREAHHAADDIKRGADKAADEARQAGKNFKEGWNEARRDGHDNPPPRDGRRPRK